MATHHINPQKYTLDDLLLMPNDGKRYELIDGEIIEVGTSSEKHSTLGAWLIGMLFVHLAAAKLGGQLKGADGTYRLDAENIKAPDVSYLTAASTAKVPPGAVFCPFAPDFAIEIKSPSDSGPFMRWLADLYLRTGTRLVWIVDFDEQVVKVYRPGQPVESFGGGDILDASNVIPGFKIDVGEMFAQIEGL